MYLILSGVQIVSIVQVTTPESSTTVDVIYLYFSAVRLGGTYPIPQSVMVLSTVQVYKEELIQTVNLIRMDQRPLIHTSH